MSVCWRGEIETKCQYSPSILPGKVCPLWCAKHTYHSYSGVLWFRMSGERPLYARFTASLCLHKSE